MSQLMEKVLPYLEFQSKNPSPNITVENFIGESITSAKKQLMESGIQYEIIGGGDTVLNQIPKANEVFTYPLSRIILYTEGVEDEYCTVPDICGLTMEKAIPNLISCGLNIDIKGNGALSVGGSDIVIYQSVKANTKIKRGSIIEIRAITTDYED
jgi:stage V sporulation protein D (sporulation-specific penicillin-binding protein)